MYDTPFGPYNGGYDDPEWFLEDDYPQETLRDKMEEADALFDLVSDMDEDEDLESVYDFDLPAPTDPYAQTEQASAPEKSPSVQARFLSDLTDQVIADGKLLITENGQAFAYQESCK